MSKYTTGEMAKMCGISVRTVQFYDTKELLTPSELTEGGRRIYSEDDLKKMRLILMLKNLGLSLDSVKGILESENRSKVMLLLLEEQMKELDKEIGRMQKQKEAIKAIKEAVANSDTIPVESINDIEHIMNEKKKLRKVHGTMLVVGIVMDLVEIGTIALWIAKGIWWPFAAGMPLVVLTGALLIRMYFNNTAYICTECNGRFKPKFREFLFAGHTPKTRKLTCTECGHKDWCVETIAD